MNTICKMKVSSLKKGLAWSTKEQKEVDANNLQATAIYDPNPESENGQFFNSTPAGSLSLTAVNLEALKGIEEGDEIYITISKVPKV